jgi:8-oxo-dGTP pyrophosphatase MutT (NUDIX family)
MNDGHTHQNPWTRLSRRRAYHNPWITVFEDQVVRPDGQPGIYGVVHFHNRAIGVVPIDDQGRVLLVGQYRYTLDQYSWEIPEGGAPFAEEPLAAARRELKEETGYTAGRWQEILRAHLSNSVSDEEAICYLATDLRPGDAAPDGTEQLQTRWAPFGTALEMVRQGQITDALSILGLYEAAFLRARGAGF